MPTTRSQYKKEVLPKLDAKKAADDLQAKENIELAKKYWWFCGHPRARIFSLRGEQHSCPDCPQARGNEIYFIRGWLHTGD